MASTLLRSATRILLVTSALVLVIPPLVFAFVGLHSDMSASDGLAALGEQYIAQRTNMAVVSGLNLFPVLLLAGFFGVRRALGRDAGKSALYAGAMPVLAVTVFVNVEYWPTFLPQRTYAGFPQGLELIVGSGAFAPVGIAVTLLVVWIATRTRVEPPAT